MELESKQRHSGSYVTSILDIPETKPLTWQQRVTYKKKNSLNDQTDSKNEENEIQVEITYAPHVSSHKQEPVTCFRRTRKPEIVIVTIAIFFIVILLSFVVVSLYYEITEHRTTADSTKTDYISSTPQSPEALTLHLSTSQFPEVEPTPTSTSQLPETEPTLTSTLKLTETENTSTSLLPETQSTPTSTSQLPEIQPNHIYIPMLPKTQPAPTSTPILPETQPTPTSTPMLPETQPTPTFTPLLPEIETTSTAPSPLAETQPNPIYIPLLSETQPTLTSFISTPLLPEIKLTPAYTSQLPERQTTPTASRLLLSTTKPISTSSIELPEKQPTSSFTSHSLKISSSSANIYASYFNTSKLSEILKTTNSSREIFTKHPVLNDLQSYPTSLSGESSNISKKAILSRTPECNATTSAEIQLSTQSEIFTALNQKEPYENSSIFFVEGSFTYEEARSICAKQGTLLALREDINEAWKTGYKRDSYGWLRDLHMVKIKEKAEEPGYEPSQDPNIKQSGAYCVSNPEKYIHQNSTGVGSNPRKSVNWWVTNDASDAYNLRHILMSVTSKEDDAKYPLMTSLKSIYTCCNAFNITNTDEENPVPYVKKRYSDSLLQKIVEIYRRELAPVKVITHVTVKYDTMIKQKAATVYRSRIIESLVTMVKEVGLDGIILDYEPRKEYTREHAAIYRTFLDHLTDAMRKNNMTVGTVVSSWGILKYYDIIGSSKVDFIGSMSSTYYGHNIENNKKRVTEMLKYITTDRLQIGLGLMRINEQEIKSRKNFRWNENNLRNFVTWFDKQGVNKIHVYPGKWKLHRKTEKYFLEILAYFSET